MLEKSCRRTKMVNKDLMPVVFVGHGSPMNGIENNEFSAGWEEISKNIPKPKAILCISAHWLTKGTFVLHNKKPKTIYDFFGFPDELYEIKYPASGDLRLAEKIKNIVKKYPVEFDSKWGLDHGCWVVLRRMYPNADVPVLQLSIDFNAPMEKHLEIGRQLFELRKEGVLIIGSGNIVHNLMMYSPGAKAYDWAIDFDGNIKNCLMKNDYDSLMNYKKFNSAQLAHPTNDHYLPLLYAVGASNGAHPIFYNEKISDGSMSMRCIVYNK